jgi:hypothetical protein
MVVQVHSNLRAGHSSTLSEQNERAAAMHSSSVMWPEGPGQKRTNRRCSGNSRARSLPGPVLQLKGRAGAGNLPEGSQSQKKRSRKKCSKSPGSSKASTRASLLVDSVSQGSKEDSVETSVLGAGVDAGASPSPLVEHTDKLEACEEGDSKSMPVTTGKLAGASDTVLSPPYGDQSGAQVKQGNVGEEGKRSMLGWLSRMLGISKAVEGERAVKKDGVGRDRQIITLLGDGKDLTRGKGEAFGAAGTKGSQTLLQQNEAARAAVVLRQRKKVEAEKGGLFRKGRIREHAPVGHRSFGFGCSCL